MTKYIRVERTFAGSETLIDEIRHMLLCAMNQHLFRKWRFEKRLSNSENLATAIVQHYLIGSAAAGATVYSVQFDDLYSVGGVAEYIIRFRQQMGGDIYAELRSSMGVPMLMARTAADVPLFYSDPTQVGLWLPDWQIPPLRVAYLPRA